jgi:SPP1 Gp6-like portal protein
MTLSLIRSALRAQRPLSQMSLDGWLADQQARGDKVRLFRDYAEGDHRANLTPEMRRLLRVSGGSLNEFNVNYMDAVIQAMADRLHVESIYADSEAGSAWAVEFLKRNRFDGMQADVHEAAIRDADTYVMAYFDNADGRVKLSHEPAYDGTSGMLALYDTATSPAPSAAVKVWHITLGDGRLADTVRVNVYYADRIERYVGADGGRSVLRPYDTDGEAAVSAWGCGVPVVHFRNRKAMYSNYGMSEIENAIPLQDALNRTLHSMVMAAELTAFQIRYAVGWSPPAALTPGMWLKISETQPLSPDERIEVGALQQGELAPYLDMARYLAGEIGSVTNTPHLAPFGLGNDDVSGESLKQREIGLIGKVTRFQVKAGNAWEDVLALAHRIESAYGRETPPAVTQFNAVWREAALRNGREVIQNALAVAEHIDARTFLELVAPEFGWDGAKVEGILRGKSNPTP